MALFKKKNKTIRLIKFGPKYVLVVRNRKNRPNSKKGPADVMRTSKDNIVDSISNSSHLDGSLEKWRKLATFDLHMVNNQWNMILYDATTGFWKISWMKE